MPNKSSKESIAILFSVVIQDRLTKKPVEYALFDNEPEAIKLMAEFLQKGQFAAVAKKRIVLKLKPNKFAEMS